MKPTKDEIQNMKNTLLAYLKPTMTIYTSLKYVSKSGMTRHIACYVAVIDDRTGKPKIRDISQYVANILGDKKADNGGVKVHGCGMDMGFNLVYNLSSTLFHNGYDCLGEDCHANDHINDHNCDRVEGKHHHKDGGYAIHQSWI